MTKNVKMTHHVDQKEDEMMTINRFSGATTPRYEKSRQQLDHPQ